MKENFGEKKNVKNMQKNCIHANTQITGDLDGKQK
jgi:hypothetical protein